MSLAELLFRLTEQLRIRKERLFFPREQQRVFSDTFNFFTPAQPELFSLYQQKKLIDLLDHPQMMRSVSEKLNEKRRQRFLSEYPGEYQKSLLRADAFLEHKFAFLGVKFRLPDPIPWQCDPVSLNPYPTGFYREINIFTNENAGDVKHVWEVNRLQFVIEIAKAYYLSGNEKYGDKVKQLILDWDRNNPYKTGIAWSSALEVGVRVLALIWILNFYKAGPKPDANVLKTLVRLIYLSGVYLHENLSIYFSPYNHLIGEAAGLFAVGYLFPGFKNAKKYEQESWRILSDQINKQFHPDGGLVEQATFYHHFTLGFFFQALAFKRLNGESVPGNYFDQLEKATEFALYMTKPEGHLPYLGDIDDARSIYFSDPTHWDFSSFQAIGAALFKRADMKQAAGHFKEDAFWILPDSDRFRFDALSTAQKKEGLMQFPDAGYTIFKKNSLFGMMDHGPLAHGVFHDETPSAAHGHADLLAIELSAFNESFLIDPGFSNYRGDFNWHSYFRSTAAHNTIEIDGQSQAKQGGILQWSHAPKFKMLNLLNEDWIQGVCAEHYGYRRLPGKPTHRRCFLFVDKAFFISVDWIFGKGSETHSIYYNQHFDSGILVKKQKDENTLLAKGQTGSLALHYFSDADEPFHIEINRGGDGPEQGWISPTYLARTPAFAARMGGEFSLPFTLLTLYLPFKNKSEWKVAGQLSGIEITGTDTKYSIRSESSAHESLRIAKTQNGVEQRVTMNPSG